MIIRNNIRLTVNFIENNQIKVITDLSIWTFIINIVESLKPKK